MTSHNALVVLKGMGFKQMGFHTQRKKKYPDGYIPIIKTILTTVVAYRHIKNNKNLNLEVLKNNVDL